jgi:hypothetical protein
MSSPPPELHRPVPLDRLAGPGGRGLAINVEADAAECAAIARRMLIPAVHALSCRFVLTPEPQGRIAATGALRARVTQTCVVSLEDFPAEVVEDFAVVFVPEDALTDTGEDPESIDELPYAGGAIDLGEAAVEQLALALDPYPRKPDAVLPEAAVQAPVSPMAALAAWRRSGIG